MRKGQNGRLLYLAEDWRHVDDLARDGVDVSDDTLAELVAFNLLERQGRRIRCRFPRFGPEVIGPVRARMQTTAGAFLDETRPQIAELAQALAEEGLAHAFYAVFFGTVMDGLLWTRLRARIPLPDTRLTAEFPLWRGAFWAIHPAVANAIGTNEIHLRHARMTLVWSDRTSAMLNAVRQEDWPTELLAFLLGERPEPPPEARTAGLVGRDSRPAVPVFGQPAMAQVSHLANRIAEHAARHLERTLHRSPLLGDMDRALRNVVLAHEYIWALQTVFGATGGGGLPVQIADTHPPEDVRRSVVLHLDPPDADPEASSGTSDRAAPTGQR